MSKSYKELLEAYQSTKNPVTRSSYRDILMQKVPQLIEEHERYETLINEMRMMDDVPESNIHDWVHAQLRALSAE